MHLLGHIERKIRAHACRWAMLPELTVESAAVDDDQTERWSREAYEDDLELERHRYPPRTLVLIAFGALLAAGIATAADVKANPDDEDARFLHALHNAGLVLLPDDDWYNNVAPMGPTASAPSADYNASRTYPPAGMPGTVQVYATPPGVHVIPSADNYCGTTTSQAQIPATCPAGWDMWYR